MICVGMEEAADNLSQPIDSALSGEGVIVEHAGRQVAKIVPYDEPQSDANQNSGHMCSLYWTHDGACDAE
jgi:antitoxin (DNA-binding transcriptional repressor) of toxin-antitoxin stability system